MSVLISVCTGSDLLCMELWRDIGPHHLLLGYHVTGIPRNACRGFSIKGWVTKWANRGGKAYLQGGSSRLWDPVISDIVGGTFSHSLLAKVDWVSCCWDYIPCVRWQASFPIHTGHDSLLPLPYVVVKEMMRQYINARRIFVHIKILPT